jgi:hypothetical protein
MADEAGAGGRGKGGRAKREVYVLMPTSSTVGSSLKPGDKDMVTADLRKRYACGRLEELPRGAKYVIAVHHEKKHKKTTKNQTKKKNDTKNANPPQQAAEANADSQIIAINHKMFDTIYPSVLDRGPVGCNPHQTQHKRTCAAVLFCRVTHRVCARNLLRR